MKDIKANIEYFHLLFLDKLSRTIQNNLYAVKEGCNLRFYFNSIRYSEDLDIDIQIIGVDTLKKNVNKILSATPFQRILKTTGISIQNISLPKQTATTQRWKISLSTSAPLPINTKIEFSRREVLTDTMYESISPSILQKYNLTPIFCTHHNLQAAFSQKIKALAGRNEVQSRDIFDLFLLINAGAKLENSQSINNVMLEKATENARSISFKEYYSQVVVYLTPEHQEQYNQEVIWQQMLTRVIESLERKQS